jgi:hypothetical protein
MLPVGVFGSQTRPPSSTPPAGEAPRGPDFVEEKGFKGKVFTTQHRDPNDLAIAIRPLGSGFKGATITPNRDFKIITVRDFPENIAAIEEALKRLDAPLPPAPPRPDIEFEVHVIVASNDASAAESVPSHLNDVIKQLRTTLKYKGYSLMASSLHRTKDGSDGVNNSGVAESKLFNVSRPQGNPIFYHYSLERPYVEGQSAPATIHVRIFNFGMRIPLSIGSGVNYENVGIRTPISLREGEKVVVGTTTIEDKGLVVLLTAKLLK